MLIVAALLLVPLGLKYLTAWHMSHLRVRLHSGDEEFRQLRERYVSVREDLLDTRRRLRQFEVRKAFLANDIRAERLRLTRLQAAGGRQRLAA